MTDIHPTAIVSPEAHLGAGVVLGPYVVIEGPVRLGCGVRLIAHVHVTGDTELGDGCIVHPFTAIGGPPQDRAYTGARSYCRIGARTVIREGVSVHCGTGPESATVVGADCMLMAGSHVAHNCVVGDQVMIINGVQMAGHVQVGHHAVIGGNAAIHQFCRVGEYTMVGGGTLVTQDAAPFMCYVDRNVCSGINRVGLRRNGFARETIDELHRLYRALFRSSSMMSHAVNDIRASVRTDAGRRLLEFMDTASRRGIGGRSS